MATKDNGDRDLYRINNRILGVKLGTCGSRLLSSSHRPLTGKLQPPTARQAFGNGDLPTYSAPQYASPLGLDCIPGARDQIVSEMMP